MQNFLAQETHSIRDFFMEHGQKLIYDKKQDIVRADDPQSWVYYLSEGIAIVASSPGGGIVRPMGYLTEGAVFAQTRSFYVGQDGELEFSTVSPCTLYRTHHDTFLKQLDTDFALIKEYLQIVNWYRVIMTDHILYLAEQKIPDRYVHWLLFMAKYYSEPVGNGCRIAIPLTQDIIADFLHASRESISKTMRDLVRSGHISVKKKHITIKDTSALRSLLSA